VALSVAQQSPAARPGVTWQLVQGARTFLGIQTYLIAATVRLIALIQYNRLTMAGVAFVGVRLRLTPR